MPASSDLTSVFVEEAGGYLGSLRRSFEECLGGTFAPSGLPGLHRLAHNLKGASAMVGLTEVNKLAAVIEQFLDGRAQAQTPPDAAHASLLIEGIDALESWIGDPAAWDARLEAVAQRLEGEFDQHAASPPPASDVHAAEFDEVRELFTLEADEHLQSMSTNLPRWCESPEDRSLLQEIRRSAHTLKGAAGMVGMTSAQGAAHRMEDLLDALYEGNCAFSSGVADTLYLAFDILEAAARDAAPKRDVAELEHRVASLLEGTPTDAPSIVEETPAMPAAESAPAESSSPFMRVRADRIGELVDHVSELAISRSAFERRMQFLSAEVGELAPNIQALRTASSRLETEFELATLGSGVRPEGEADRFDELELDRYTEFHNLSRSIQERMDDISNVQGRLNQILADFDQTLNRQRRLSRDIHDGLMTLRMVPFETLASRLARTTRQTAQTLNRSVSFRLQGGAVEVDKSVLDALSDPLMHAIRNAVDHGIEDSEERSGVGKPPGGLVEVSVSHEGTQVVVRIRDDGRGVDLNDVRRRAIARGILDPARAESLSERDTLELLFVAGFSTSANISEISGRGVGMDIIASQAEKLGGSVRLSSTHGSGSTLEFRIPMALAIMRAMSLVAGSERYALPLAAVSRVLRMPFGDVADAPTKGLEVEGETLRFAWLHRLLDLPLPEADASSSVSVLIVPTGHGRIALCTEGIEGAQDIVVKDLASHAQGSTRFLGGSVTGDGRVVLILDPEKLAEMEPRTRSAARTAVLPAQRRTQILLVDDSVSVRRVVSSQLSMAGMDIATASNGEHALEVLDGMQTLPDAIILDIEMPRMDGFELMGLLRSSERYRGIPVAFQTSRAGARHRSRAAELGATAYLVKPYDEKTLLETIDRMLGEGS